MDGEGRRNRSEVVGANIFHIKSSKFTKAASWMKSDTIQMIDPQSKSISLCLNLVVVCFNFKIFVNTFKANTAIEVFF